MKLSKKCLQCKATFVKPKNCGMPEWTNKRAFCSHKCYGASMNGVNVPEVRREKISSTMKERGISPVKKWGDGMEPPRTSRKKEKHWNWKNGISKEKDYGCWLSKRRRSRLEGSGGSHTENEWETLKAQYNWTCPCCKKSEPFIGQHSKKLTQDHIIPLSKGGSDNIENVQPLCHSCNAKKRNKIIPKY